MTKTPQRKQEQNPPNAAPPRSGGVACYNCRRPVVLNGEPRQRCPRCSVPLSTPPAWARDAGWPKRAVPPGKRGGCRYRARVGWKQIKFQTPEEHAILHHLEDVQKEQGVCLNDLLLSIFEDWLKQTLGPEALRDAHAADEPGRSFARLMTKVGATA